MKNRFHYRTKRQDHSGNWKHGLLPQEASLYYVNSPHPLFITDARLDCFHVRSLRGKPQQPAVPARGRGAAVLVQRRCVLRMRGCTISLL